MTIGQLFSELERRAKELGYLSKDERPQPVKAMPSPRMPPIQARMPYREPGEDSED